MASKTRSLARGIAHERMKEVGIYRPNAKHRVKGKNKVISFFSLNWREYVFPPVKKKSKKIRKRGA
ncbi:MAG: hypothetical protein ACI4Q8_02640 [Ruminococcus sp.]